MFRNNWKCSQTKSRNIFSTIWDVPKQIENVPEHSEMFQNKVLNVSELFNCSNVPVQFWNVFPNISEIFYRHIWNFLKHNEMFPNKPEIFLIIQNIIKCLTLFIWVLFHANTLRCSQTNLNVSKHSKMFRTFLDCFWSFRILWSVLNLSKFSNVLV